MTVGFLILYRERYGPRDARCLARHKNEQGASSCFRNHDNVRSNILLHRRADYAPSRGRGASVRPSGERQPAPFLQPPQCLIYRGKRTLGRSGQIRSQRSCSCGASRLGQSPLSCSRHFIMWPSRPYFSINLATLYRPLRSHFVHSTRSTFELALDVAKDEIASGHLFSRV